MLIMHVALMGFHNVDSVIHLFNQERKNVLGNISNHMQILVMREYSFLDVLSGMYILHHLSGI
jgi:hypothetical protein